MVLAGSLEGPGLEGGLESGGKVGSQGWVWLDSSGSACSWGCRVENEGEGGEIFAAPQARRALSPTGLAAGEAEGCPHPWLPGT